ncbi:DUF2341 domain-containing protein [Candidatus Micrarchaeota archaeon]|nr:DUF2341 domain-containing protein [Candidatus Micrarchaeota archaeon]
MHTLKPVYMLIFAICLVSLACASGEGYFYAEYDGESYTSATSYVDGATLQFTLEESGDYLVLASADLMGTSSRQGVLARLQIDGSTYAEYAGEPEEAIYGEYFIAHKTIPLGAGAHTIKIQYAAETSSASTYIRDARILALNLAEYSYAENESERELTENYESIAASTFAVQESGDYLVIASSEYRPATTSTSVFANTLIDNSSMAESLLGAREIIEYKPHFSAKVETLSAGNHTINLMGKSEAGAKYMRRARITAIPLNGSFDYAYAASEAETTNGGTSPESKVELNFTPSAEADYVLLSVGLIGGDATAGAEYSSYTETEIDGSAINTAQLGFKDDGERHSLFTLKNLTLNASEHSFGRTYWSGASSDPDASLANARIILLSPLQEAEPNVTWNVPTLDLGFAYIGEGEPSGSANVTSGSSNTNVSVTCESGDCATISDDWNDATSMGDGQSLPVGFTCDDSNAGVYSAVFSVVSAEDASADEINVSCEIQEDLQELYVSLTSPANGSSDTDGDVTFECSALDSSGLANATLYGSWATTGQVQGIIWFENSSSWKYDASNTYPGSSWTANGFDDSGWPSGTGLLGYDTASTEYISTTLPIGSYPYVSYYFRREFSVTDASAVTEMNFTIDYDDGYVVFINGQEVDRSENMAGVDETDHADLATAYHNWYCDSGTCGGGSTPQLPTYTLTSGQLGYLVDGTNTIAVLIKQSSTSSSDAAFELRLFGAQEEAPEWGAIETKGLSGTSDSASFSVENMEEGTYGWNCLVHNSSGGFAWAAENYSVTVAIIPNQVPESPTLVAPEGGSISASTSPTLDVIVSDAEGGEMNVSFYGRALPENYSAAENWTLILVPDTQYYAESYPEIFLNQTQWIVANESANNIRLAMHAGDIVNVWNSESQWETANESLSYLINNGIPYTPTPGDHDRYGQTPDGAMDYFYEYLPASRFSNNSWWGGDYNNNTNHYMLMTIEGEDYIFIGLDFCPSTDELEWANQTLAAYSDRKAILATHSFMDDTGEYYGTSDCSRYGGDTTYMWEGLFKYHDNLQVILCAHMHLDDGEYYKQETNVNGVPVHILMSDYQSRESGGNGRLRIMEFDPEGDRIYVYTYSPYTGTYETDTDSQFVLEYNMSGAAPDFVNIGNATGVANGSHATFAWEGLDANITYEWYAIVDDGRDTTQGEIWNFTTSSGVSIVAWDSSALDLGSGLLSAGALEGSAGVLSYNSNEGVTIECASGDCSTITEDWLDTIGMENGQQFEANFTCSDSSAGSYSAVFNLSSLNDTSAAQVTVSCEILPLSVSWNESSLSLGSGSQEGGSLQGSAILEAVGANNNVSVSCDSGNCTQITTDFANGISLQDAQEFEVNFTCSNSSAGSFSATFGVISNEDTTPGSLEASCIITESGGELSVTLNSPQNGTKNYDGNLTFECSANASAGLANVTLYGNWGAGGSGGEQPVVWIENNSLWSYNDSDVWPGADWNGTSFDDSSWPTGYATLGYDSSASEYINTTLEISGEAYTSYYFRREFSVADASAVTEMNFTIDYDDGYVVFINGYEVNRSGNLMGVDETNHDAPTTVYHNWYCDSGTCGDNSDPMLPTYTLDAAELGYLVDGANTIAVLIKQTSSSTDVAFELRLFGAQEQQAAGEWSAMETKSLSGTSDSASFNVTGIANGTYEWNCLAFDSIGNSAFAESNYTFTVDPEVIWNASSLNLGSGVQGSGSPEGSATVISIGVGGNTGVSVDCVSGDCATISEDWVDTTNMGTGQEFEANFTCSDLSAGNFSATFELTSNEDSTADSLVVSCGIIAGGEEQEWWDEEFSKCMDITIENAGTTELTSFPAYVHVAYDSDMNADFSDLRFVNESCGSNGTGLDYEIEYSDANHADTWVGLDSLPIGGKTISLYYGNPSASPAHNPSGVWDSDYASVYHFNHTSGSALDTKGYLDASEAIGPDTNMDVAGITGRADYFDGDDRLIVTDWNLGTSGDRPHTYCAWVSYTGTGDMLIVEDGATAYGDGLGTTGGSLRYGACVANSPYAADSSGSYNDGAWHMACGVTTSSRMELYVDGEFESSVAQLPYPGTNNGGIGATNGNGNGVFDDSAYHYFTGYIDEMHLSFDERSADWINQSYNVVANQGSFVVFGSEQSKP